MTATTVHPPINWAQRNDVVLITIPLQDATDVQIALTENFTFSATSAGKSYSCTVPLFDKVVPEESSHVIRPRQIELKIRKADTEKEYWPRLTKEKSKSAYIQIDWNKWKDEDEVEGGSAGEDLGDFGMGGGGMGGMGGMDMQQMLAQLGGAGGMGAMGGMPGMPGMSGMPDFGSAAGQKETHEGAPAEDEEMPPLED